VERLLAQREDRACEVQLRDGTIPRLTFGQVLRGCQDSIRNTKSYESFIVQHAASSRDEYAHKTLDMYHAVKYPVET
jgi:hypothetical protein